MALRQLADLGSASAGIITRLKLTREIAQMAMSALRGERSAQVTLMSISGGTQFRTYFHGAPVPTCYPRVKRMGVCAGEDSYEHLIWRYRVRGRERFRPESPDFLLAMARRAAPPVPGTVRPMLAHRERATRRISRTTGRADAGVDVAPSEIAGALKTISDTWAPARFGTTNS